MTSLLAPGSLADGLSRACVYSLAFSVPHDRIMLCQIFQVGRTHLTYTRLSLSCLVE